MYVFAPDSRLGGGGTRGSSSILPNYKCTLQVPFNKAWKERLYNEVLLQRRYLDAAEVPYPVTCSLTKSDCYYGRRASIIVTTEVRHEIIIIIIVPTHFNSGDVTVTLLPRSILNYASAFISTISRRFLKFT
jgi:hypothetical protein